MLHTPFSTRGFSVGAKGWPDRSILSTLAIVFLSALAACGSGSEASSEHGGGASAQAVPVSAVTAERRDVPIQLPAIGNVEPYSSVTVKSQVEGQLSQVHFEEGQQVSKGQLLFTVDPRPYEAAVQQAEANLARDRAEAENAGVEAKRQAQLIKNGFTSRNEYDAVATKAAALEAAAKADEALLETVKLRLQYCYIHSPIDGRIGAVVVHEGNVIKVNETTLAVVNQLRPIFVTFAVPEKHLSEIRGRSTQAQLHVEVQPEGEGVPAVAGELSFIDNAVDSKTGTVTLKAIFANQDESLWPGQFVNVRLTLQTLPGAVVIPFAAVQDGQEGQYVFVITAEQTVDVRPVRIGPLFGANAVIANGLEAGERVVTEGQVRLAAGVRVEVKETTENLAQQADKPAA